MHKKTWGGLAFCIAGAWANGAAAQALLHNEMGTAFVLMSPCAARVAVLGATVRAEGRLLDAS